MWVSDVPPQEGLDGRIAQLELEKLEYVALHLEQLLFGVGVVCDVAEVLRVWRADLLVLPASTRPKSVPNPSMPKNQKQRIQCGVALTQQ